MASIVVERIVDGIAIGVVGIISLHLLGTSASGKYVEFARSASVLVAAGFLALCAGLVLAVVFHDRALLLAHPILEPPSPPLGHRAAGTLDAFIRAVHQGPGVKLLACLLRTLVC